MTALHVAISMRKTSFAEKLVNCMEMHDLEIPMVDGNTAFCLAAMTGNVKIAGILLRKNRRLLWIRGQNNMLPIQLASSAGHISMAEFLFQALPLDLHNIMPFQDIANLFFFSIHNNIYSNSSSIYFLNARKKIIYGKIIYMLSEAYFFCIYLTIVFHFFPYDLCLVITAVASKLLNRYPKLATMENEGGFTALQMLAQIC